VSEQDRRGTLAIDFDGVLHRYSQGWHDGTIYDPPVPGSVEAMTTLARRYALFVHTTRDPEMTAAWLVRHYPLGFVVEKLRPDDGVMVRVGFGRDPNGQVEAHVLDALPEPVRFWDSRVRVLVTDRKLPALAYIDDRAIRFVHWRQTLMAVDNLATHGEPVRPPATR
jgi:hypothetical protein